MSKKFFILLDNGHGSNTSGKRSPKWADGSQLFEWEYTRRVTEELERRLRTLGFRVERIVKEESDVPLQVRCDRVNELASEYRNYKVLLVSVHCNAMTGKAQGWEVWTSPGKTEADTLATFVWESAKKHLGKEFPMRGDFSDGDPDWEGNLYILKHTTCPAILTENLFMDNEEDCKFLLSPKGFDTIVQLHVDGIVDYTNSK